MNLSKRNLRVIVCGGRDYQDAETVGAWLGGIHNSHTIAVIIEGGQTGADRLARYFGEYAGIKVDTYEANWREHGPAGGPIRNRTMLQVGKPDLVVAFPGGSGTADMIRQAERAGVPVLRVRGAFTPEGLN